jgi:hypothetical protein
LSGQHDNALVTTVGDSGIGLWDSADRLGFYVLRTATDSARFLEHRNDLSSHPSTFAWIFNRADFAAGPHEDDERPMFYGVNTSARSSPPNADFLVCQENELSWLEDVALPKLITSKKQLEASLMRSDAIGVIEIT